MLGEGRIMIGPELLARMGGLTFTLPKWLWWRGRLQLPHHSVCTINWVEQKPNQTTFLTPAIGKSVFDGVNPVLDDSLMYTIS